MHRSIEMLKKELIIYGKASGKTQRVAFSQSDADTPLMKFLIQHSIPIASSCRGEGICKKCQLGKVLSCQISLQEYIKNFGDYLEIDYW